MAHYTSYVPAAEFRELDGQKIDANSTLKFRVPPLSSSFWMEPEATIVDIRYELEATNPVLSALELVLQAVNLRSTERSIRYLVVSTTGRSRSRMGSTRLFVLRVVTMIHFPNQTCAMPSANSSVERTHNGESDWRFASADGAVVCRSRQTLGITSPKKVDRL